MQTSPEAAESAPSCCMQAAPAAEWAAAFQHPHAGLSQSPLATVYAGSTNNIKPLKHRFGMTRQMHAGAGSAGSKASIG